jgi:uncharacterized protein YhbP (UPF0306 family)
MIHRQIKNLHMFGRLMQYEKKPMNEANYFFIFFDQNASVIYLTVAAQA